jgi:hypothetical protein
MCSDKSSTNQRADHDVVSPRGPTIFIADPHRGDGKRFVVRADERLTAFLELERVTRESFRFSRRENVVWREFQI